MGPEGGSKGGLVLATGRPEEVAEVAESHTGQFLRHSLALTGKPSGAPEATARAAKANGTTVAKPRSTRSRAKATV
jgi:excinuclease ABC subunit A